jgi:hypothetical protein
MRKLLLWMGRVGGVVGVILCAIAVIVRLRGAYNFDGFQVGTLLLAGMAAMIFGCLGYLASLAERGRS